MILGKYDWVETDTGGYIMKICGGNELFFLLYPEKIFFLVLYGTLTGYSYGYSPVLRGNRCFVD